MTEKNVNKHTQLVRDPEILATPMDNEIVMMSVENGEYYGLNPVASRIWRLFEEPQTMSQLVETLLDEFNIDRERCQAETEKFVQQLVDKKLIKPV